MNVYPYLTPAISITASTNNICPNTLVTFSASLTNGGSSPQLQWKKNGINVGTNYPLYSSSSLTNGDIITCSMVSNIANNGCVTGFTANSNSISMNVLPMLPNTVSISASSNYICPGDSVTLTASAANGGTNPVYTWKKYVSPGNYVTVGSNSPTYTTPPLSYSIGGHNYMCIVQSNAVCANPITGSSTKGILVGFPTTPTLSISTPTINLCSPTQVIFTAFGTNLGTSPIYQWKKNGLNVGVNSTQYIDSSINNFDSISCILISNANCLTTSVANSNTIIMNVSTCLTTVNLRMFLQGFYIGSSYMSPSLMNQGVGTNNLITDTITVELRNENSPYGVVAVTKALLNTNGNATCTFPSITGNYYVAVKHRNGLQTWSSVPVSVGVAPITYDFSNTAGKAYGSNQTEVETGVWALYSGDLNLDENIDLLDLSNLELDINTFIFGYYATDINGDGNVDLLDAPVVEGNINNFIFSFHP